MSETLCCCGRLAVSYPQALIVYIFSLYSLGIEFLNIINGLGWFWVSDMCLESFRYVSSGVSDMCLRNVVWLVFDVPINAV